MNLHDLETFASLALTGIIALATVYGVVLRVRHERMATQQDTEWQAPPPPAAKPMAAVAKGLYVGPQSPPTMTPPPPINDVPMRQIRWLEQDLAKAARYAVGQVVPKDGELWQIHGVSGQTVSAHGPFVPPPKPPPVVATPVVDSGLTGFTYATTHQRFPTTATSGYSHLQLPSQELLDEIQNNLVYHRRRRK